MRKNAARINPKNKLKIYIVTTCASHVRSYANLLHVLGVCVSVSVWIEHSVYSQLVIVSRSCIKYAIIFASDSKWVGCGDIFFGAIWLTDWAIACSLYSASFCRSKHCCTWQRTNTKMIDYNNWTKRKFKRANIVWIVKSVQQYIFTQFLHMWETTAYDFDHFWIVARKHYDHIIAYTYESSTIFVCTSKFMHNCVIGVRLTIKLEHCWFSHSFPLSDSVDRFLTLTDLHASKNREKWIARIYCFASFKVDTFVDVCIKRTNWH